jgi:glycosyltransferase involved in cell wall biosynthesis
MSSLRISVVIPVYNSATELDQCLAALSRSKQAPIECIVVDDGSTDDSAGIAARHGVKVLSTRGRYGPARARNIGAKAANGDILLFLDADVSVHPDTLSRITAEFATDLKLVALMGSYDSSPSARDFVSQYRNLLHCFVHHHSKRLATTFWAGCGAIRRQTFLDFCGFNENYRSPSIEDIELGYRLAQANQKVILNADIQVKHLKHWNLRGMIKADFFYRALPWSELSLRSGVMPNDLNLCISQRISVALVAILIVLATYLSVHSRAYFLTPLFATFFILLSGYWIESSVSRSTSAMMTMGTVLSVIVGLSYWFHMFAIIPMVLLASLALFTRHRYASTRESWRRRTGILVGGYALLVIGLVWIYLPWHTVGFSFLLLLLILVLLNNQFYVFLAADRGKLFALAAIPFHLLYFASSGVAFTLASIRHSGRRFARRSTGATRPSIPPKKAEVKAPA